MEGGGGERERERERERRAREKGGRGESASEKRGNNTQNQACLKNRRTCPVDLIVLVCFFMPSPSPTHPSLWSSQFFEYNLSLSLSLLIQSLSPSVSVSVCKFCILLTVGSCWPMESCVSSSDMLSVPDKNTHSQKALQKCSMPLTLYSCPYFPNSPSLPPSLPPSLSKLALGLSVLFSHSLVLSLFLVLSFSHSLRISKPHALSLILSISLPPSLPPSLFPSPPTHSHTTHMNTNYH